MKSQSLFCLIGDDFSFISGAPPFNVTFNPTDDRKAVVLNITDDQLAEGNEFINLQLTNFSSYIRIGQQMADIKIQDDEGKQYFVVVEISTNITCTLFSGDSRIQ